MRKKHTIVEISLFVPIWVISDDDTAISGAWLVLVAKQKVIVVTLSTISTDEVRDDNGLVSAIVNVPGPEQ